jgi:hypothetical protein
MFHRILTAEERDTIRKYLAKDGEKEHHIRNIVSRARRLNKQRILDDLKLIDQLLARYEAKSGR